MKVYKYLFACLVFLVCFNSCNDKLEVSNPNQLSPETFFLNEAQVQAAVNAIYANLQTRGLYTRHMFFAMDNMAHENAGNPQLESDKAQYLQFSFDASHGAIRAFWESCYRGINKANFVITNEDKINAILESELATEKKAKYIGEAKFLRAFYYFLLVSRFGDVPLLLSVPETGDGTPKSSSEEVYQQIIKDLGEAASVLYTEADAGHELGRATQGAANALLGKVHLFRGEYDLAKAAFTKVLGDYALTDDYSDNFLEETEHNSESIFEVEYQVDLGQGDKWNSDASGEGLNEVTFRGQEYGWNDWFNVYPSDDLINEYEDGDSRYVDNFYSNGETFAGGNVSLPLSRVAAWKKYQNYYKQANENQASGINFRVIRYADVLLMMAEIENELNNPSAAIGYLNEVRNRPSVNMPNYGTPEMNAIYPVSTKEEIFNAIVHERKVELAGEQVRFPDLVRWGIAEDFLGDYGFKVGKHELFPIPQNEINANNSLTTDDQNPGY
jgi:hypothetical protein